MPVIRLFLDLKRRWKTQRIQGFAKTCVKIKRSTAQQTRHFLCFFPPTFTSSILSTMFTGACGPPEKLSFALVPRFGAALVRLVLKNATDVTLDVTMWRDVRECGKLEFSKPIFFIWPYENYANSSSAIWSCLTNKLRVFFRFSWGAFFLASRKGLWSNWPLFRVRFRTLLGNWPNV